MPKLLSHKSEEFEKKYNLPKDLTKELIGNDLFEGLAKKLKNLEPLTIANSLITIPKEIKTRFNLDSSKLTNHDFEEVLNYLNQGKIAKEAVIDLLIKKIKNEKIDLKEFAGISEKDLEKEIKDIISSKPGLNAGAYMGIMMGKYRGKVDGKKVMDILNKLLR